MTDSVYQRVLGLEFGNLRAELQDYFRAGGVGVGVGVFEVAGSRRRILRPLLEFLGRRRGLEVRLRLTVTDGLLRIRSDRQWLHLGRARIPLPRFATVTVAESWTDGSQHVDVRLRSPLLGEWFRYAGSFSYRYEER